MLTLYSWVLRCLVPVFVLRLLWRSRHHRGYRRALAQRLGYRYPLAEPTTQPRIWLHAVSVGETLAMAPLVENLLITYPERRILITSTTPTGAEQVQRLFGERVDRCWMPFDTPGAIRRFLGHWQPGILLLAETELWPNSVLQTRARQVPVVVLNARLSERSAHGYARIRALSQPVFSALTAVACQQQADADRFQGLGTPAQQIRVVGSVKFDVTVAKLQAHAKALADELSLDVNRPYLMAASTHPGEEALVLEAFGKLRAYFSDLGLLLAPRHPNRTANVRKAAIDDGWRVVTRSSSTAFSASDDVLLIDTLGELGAFTGLASVAFVGGSLVVHGGHNPLEAAGQGVPTVFGPHTFNFEVICEQLLEVGASQRVADVPSLVSALQRWLSVGDEVMQAGQAARDFVAARTGATERQIQWLGELLAP